MASPLREDIDGYNFTWIIKNGSLCLLRPYEWIRAPVLPINFMLTEWVFYLRYIPEQSQEWITIYLQRNIDDGPECIRIVVKDLKLAGMGQEKNVESLDTCFKKGDIFQIFKLDRKPDGDILNALYPSNDKIELTCILIPSPEPIHCKELNQFSEDMKKLFISENCCDSLLRSVNTEIKIHRAILEARAYGLQIKEKSYDQDIFRIRIPDVEESSFRELLLFLYSAQTTTSSTTREELIATAETLGIENFDEKYLVGPSDWNADTMLPRKRKCIRVNVHALDCDTTDNRTFILIGTSWRFSFNFSKSHKTEIVRIAVSPKAPVNLPLDVSSLNVRLVLIMEDFCGSVLARKTRYWNLKNESDKSVKLFLKYKKKDHDLKKTPSPIRTFFFTMDAWYGKPTSTSRTKWVKTNTRNVLSDIMILGADLCRLFEREMFADSTIILHDGKLRVHKAILSARSPVFARMFQEDMKREAKGEIFEEEFDKNVMEILLRHIYGGQVALGDTTVIIQLASAADNYGMEILKERCLSYLTGNLDVSAAFDVYCLSHYLHNEELKNVTKEYIQKNICIVCAENLAGAFKNHNPILFKEIFKEKQCTCVPIKLATGDAQENGSTGFKSVEFSSGVPPRALISGCS